MADEGSLKLTADTLRDEIINYSQQHPNDFGMPDGRDRIPMKKLMKLFEIKKKSSMERQNLFREIVNDICDLEMFEEMGKVLVLRDNDDRLTTRRAIPSPGTVEQRGFVGRHGRVGRYLRRFRRIRGATGPTSRVQTPRIGDEVQHRRPEHRRRRIQKARGRHQSIPTRFDQDRR